MYSEEEREEILRKVKLEKAIEEENQLIREYEQKKLRAEIAEYQAKLRTDIPREELIDPSFKDKDFEKSLKKNLYERIV